MDHPSPNAYAWFGEAVAGVGDVNADGVPDLLVGARFHDGAIPDEGMAFVLSGANGTLLHSVRSPNPQEFSSFGCPVLAVGDVNNDGVPDFAISARDQNVGNTDAAGRVFVFSGTNGALIRTLDSPQPTYVGEFGYSLAALGDINADGVPDILVGQIGHGTFISNGQVFSAFRGIAFVFSGRNGNVLLTITPPNPQVLAFFGAAVAGTRDVNADGVPDLVIAATGQDVGGDVSAGQVYVFSGSNGALLRTLNSPSPKRYGLFGFSIAAVGDANGDTFSDLLVGARFEDVGTNVDQGRAYLFNGVDGALLRSIDNPSPGSRTSFGGAVADAGDVTGDGSSDLLIGAQGEYRFSDPSIQGAAYVFSGSDGSRVFTLDHPSPEATARYGAAVARVGDLNNDGIPDLAAGAPYQNSGTNVVQGRAFLFTSDLRGNYRYAPKLICGVQNDPQDQRLAPGAYFSTINIANTGSSSARVSKRVALTIPPGDEKPGKVAGIGAPLLETSKAIAVDCAEISTRVFNGSWPAPYIEASLILHSTQPIDVTGVYSASQAAKGPVVAVSIERFLGDHIEVPSGAPLQPALIRSGTVEVGVNSFVELDGLHPSNSGFDFKTENGQGGRLFTPLAGAKIHVGGATSVGKAGCQAAPLSNQSFVLNPTAVPIGTHFCVQTDLGRIAELRLVSVGPASQRVMSFDFNLWQAVP